MKMKTLALTEDVEDDSDDESEQGKDCSNELDQLTKTLTTMDEVISYVVS
jgi:hypothetical protein